MTLSVAWAAEGEYVRHGAAMVHSLLEQHPGAEVRFLHGAELSGEDADGLAETVRSGGGTLRLHEIPAEWVEGLPVDRYTPAMWYRLFLPEVASDLDRVLYLDADTIVVRSLDRLWATDLGDRWLGAVTNIFQPNHIWRAAELGMRRDAYFNSGVLLLNLAQLRADDRTTALLELVRARSAELEWPDQDALNLVLHRRRVPLHPRWNATNALRDLVPAARALGPLASQTARLRPAIRHFEGPGSNKPWHRGARRSARELYARHRRATPWPEFSWEG